jgi:threonine/homoserine/homoserine lactone efflux protein
MTTIAFVSGVLALLLAPGPTNTLMGLAGAQGGLVHVIRLIPAELAGYAMAILPLSFLGAALFQAIPGFELLLKGAAAIWIAVLAIKLWRSLSTGGTGKEISAGRVFITTLLNPKALVFGLVLLPSPQTEGFAPHLALFAVMVIGVALVWGSLGVMTQISSAGTKRLRILQRVASAWLMFVSVSLMVNLSLG